MLKKEFYAVLSGLCASLASAFGKFINSFYTEQDLFVTFILFLLMIISNAFVWILLVRALREANSSLTAISLSTATNYLISGLIGYFLFNELSFILWCSGTSIILCGLILIISDENNENIVQNKYTN